MESLEFPVVVFQRGDFGWFGSQEKGEGSVLHQNMWRCVACQAWALVIMLGV